MKIEIENNIPFESKNPYRQALIEMQSGQSFKFPIEDYNKLSVAYQFKKADLK